MVKISYSTQFYEFLSDKITSCSHAAETLGIRQKNLTWSKRELEKAGRLQVVKKMKCPETGRVVQGITTDPNKFTKPIQLELNFDQ